MEEMLCINPKEKSVNLGQGAARETFYIMAVVGRGEISFRELEYREGGKVDVLLLFLSISFLFYGHVTIKLSPFSLTHTLHLQVVW